METFHIRVLFARTIANTMEYFGERRRQFLYEYVDSCYY